MVLPRVTLTGTYVEPDGTPIPGWVDFCPPSILTFSDEPTFIACCSRAYLSEGGTFTVDLVATDAPGSNIEDEWFYEVHEQLQCDNGERTYFIGLPAASSPIDLAQIAPTTQPPTLNYLRLPGPQGPSGQLEGDAGGDLTGTYPDPALADTPTARANLGLGDSATQDVGTASGTVAAGDDARITGAVQRSGDTMTGPLSFATGGVDVDVQRALGATMSTGIISGGRISGSATPQSIDVAPLVGFIVDAHTDPDAPTVSLVQSGAQTVLLTAASQARPLTWFLMDSLGSVDQQAERPNPEQLRTRLVLGAIVYNSDTAEVFIALSAANDPTQLANNWADHADALGPFKVGSSELMLSPNGSNLSLDLSAGQIFSRGFQRYSTTTGLLTQSPNRLSVAPRSAFSFFRSTRNFTGSEPSVNVVDPANYDLDGTLTPVGGGSGQATIQRMWMAANGLVGEDVVIQYGQQTYSSLALATSSIGTAPFEIGTSLEDNAILVGYIVMVRTATNLSDPGQATVLSAGKFAAP